MVPNFTIFLILTLHFKLIKCFFGNIKFFVFFVFFVCSLKDSQNYFMQYLPLYTFCLIYILLNDYIVDIEKPDGICSPTCCG